MRNSLAIETLPQLMICPIKSIIVDLIKPQPIRKLDLLAIHQASKVLLCKDYSLIIKTTGFIMVGV